MKKISILNVFLMLLIVLSFTFTGKAKAEDDYQLFDKVVLVVNGEPVLKSDLEFAKNWYNIKDDKEAEEKIINSLLLAQQARRMGISVSPQEVDNAVLNIAKANGINDLETFKKKLEDSGISYSKLKEFLARDMLANRLLHLYMREKASKGIIEGTKENVKTVRLIFISKNRPDYQEVLSKLDKELNKNNFSEFASKYSDDKFTAENKGLIGEIKKGDLVKELDEAIFSHKAGDIFKVEINEGTYFIYIEKEENKLIPKTEMSEKEVEKLKKEYDLLLKKLKEQAVIQRLG
jgi:parvulin-like peptidyl-prolyl isomerase